MRSGVSACSLGLGIGFTSPGCSLPSCSRSLSRPAKTGGTVGRGWRFGFPGPPRVTSAPGATGRAASLAAVPWVDTSPRGSTAPAQGREQGLAPGSPCIPASPEGTVQDQGREQGSAQGSPCIPASPGDTAGVQGREQGSAQGSPCIPASPGYMELVQGREQGLARGFPCIPASPEGTELVQGKKWGLAQGSPCTPASPGDKVWVRGREQGLAWGSPCTPASPGDRELVQGREQGLAPAALYMVVSLEGMGQAQGMIQEGKLVVACIAVPAAVPAVDTRVSRQQAFLLGLVPLLRGLVLGMALGSGLQVAAVEDTVPARRMAQALGFALR
uniref:Uncharacterized protein n=1 Tax=Apteryx owenii TaxID=8824 RepID=A0A8B9NW47_APTOW